jgi:hypothetical protein
MRVATTRLARVIARLQLLRAIVRIRAPPARIEILPPDAFSSSGSEEGLMEARIGTASTLFFQHRSLSGPSKYDSNCHQKQRFPEQRN